MQDWLSSFANPSFMPHGHCYLWRADILWTHVISDLSIAAAYYAIPLVLAIFLYKRRQSIPHPEILGLFVAFIFLCGTTHLVNIYVTWHPLYEIQGWVKAATALVSVATAMVLIPRLPSLLALPDLQQAYREGQEALQEAERRNTQMEAVYNTAIERENRLLDLKQEVNTLRKQFNLEPKYADNEGSAV